MNPGPIILDLEGLELTPEEAQILMHPLVGGVIFFRRNYESPEQLARLAANIRRLRPSLILCVDQEGGRVQRFTHGLTALPPLRAIGDLLTTKTLPEVLAITEQLGQLMALEVRGLGVDLSFAPVVDIDHGLSEIIGDRSFHNDPLVTSILASAYIQGMHKCGMASTAKHFPGHGAVVLDSHVALPVDERSMEAIASDLQPFRALIANKVKAIMPAHIVFSQVDPQPVGFSSYWLKTILREQCGFQGVIVSDDLDMAGAHIMGDFTARAEAALSAGCDVILVCNNRAGALSILDNLNFTDNMENQQRRMQLLAQGVSPSFDEITHSPIWQNAKQALTILNKTL